MVSSKRRGTSLIEIMVAIVILSVGLLSLVVVQAFAAKSRTQNQAHFQAAQLAATEVAQAQEAYLQDPQIDLRKAAVAAPGGMTVNIETVKNWDGSSALQAVTVIVSYPSANHPEGGRVRVWTLLRQPD